MRRVIGMVFGAGLGVLVTGMAGAATLTWDNTNADGLWNTTSANWLGTSTTWNNATPDSALFDNVLKAGIVTLGEHISVADITFDVAGYTLSGTPDLTLSAPSTITANSDATIEAQMVGSGGLTKAGLGTLTLTDSNGYTGDTVVEVGTLALDKAHSHILSTSSKTTVKSGATLAIRQTNAMRRNAGDAAIILDGGTLDHQAGAHAHIGDITLKDGALWTATSTSNYDGENVQFNGTVTVSGTSASTIGPFTYGIGLNGNRTFNVADVTASADADLIVSGELENNDGGPGDGIIKTGAGTMQLTRGASYSGPTEVSAGRLWVRSTLRSTSTFTVNSSGVLELDATNILVGGHGIAVGDSRVITVNGGTLLMAGRFDSRFGNVTLNDGATWTSNRALTGWDALLANTSAGAATVTVGGSGASLMNGSGGIHIKGVQHFDVGDVTGDAAADLTVNMILDDGGNAGGTGGVYKTGAGTMVISKRASYTGGTTVNSGIFQINGGGNSSAGAIRGSLTINDGGRVHLNYSDSLGYGSGADSVSAINIIDSGVLHRTGGANETLGSVAITMDGGTISASNANQHYDLYGGGTTLTANNAGAVPGRESVISAQIDLRQANSLFTVNSDAVLRVNKIGDDGSSFLTKAGVGRLIIDGDTGYSAQTRVNEGTLELNGTHSSAGAYTVAAGATLTGGGSTDAAVTVSGSVAPGNSPGTLSLYSLTLSGGALDYEVNGAASDLLIVTDTLDITDGTLNFSDLGGGWTENVYVIAQYGTLAGGSFSSVNGLDTGYTVVYDYDGGSTIAAVIPEPALLSLVGLALVGGLVGWRRRKNASSRID